MIQMFSAQSNSSTVMLLFVCNRYRVPTKLREGNVFTSICLSTWGVYPWFQVLSGVVGWVSLIPVPFRGQWGSEYLGVDMSRGEYPGGEYPGLSTQGDGEYSGVNTQGMSTQWWILVEWVLRGGWVPRGEYLGWVWGWVSIQGWMPGRWVFRGGYSPNTTDI